jgi:hypothetical protein
MMTSPDVHSISIVESTFETQPTSFLDRHKGKLVTGVALFALGLLLAGGVLVYFDVNTLAGWILIGGGWVIGVADVIAGVVMFSNSNGNQSNDIVSNRSPSTVATEPLKTQRVSRIECAKLILSKALDVDTSLITISISEDAKITSNFDRGTIIFDDTPDSVMTDNQDDYEVHLELANRVHAVLGIQSEMGIHSETGNITIKIGEKTLYDAVRDYHFKKFTQERLNRLQGNQAQQLDVIGYKIKCEKSQIKTFGDLCFLIHWTTGKYYFQLSNTHSSAINYNHRYQTVTDFNGLDITNQELSEDFCDKIFTLTQISRYD